MYPRNAASPPFVLVGEVVQISDGALQTSGASARVKTGTGSWGAAAGTLACDVTSNFWTYTPTQAETDAEAWAVAVYKSGCYGCGVEVVTTANSTSGMTNVGSINSVATTSVTTVSAYIGSTGAAVNGTNANTLSSHDPGATIGTSTLTQTQVTGGSYALNSSSFAFNSSLDFTTTQKAATLARVTLTDTASTVTDGAKSATALSTATWTGTLATNLGTTNSTVATNLDATITSRMATYTQPTGFLAATFPSTVASTTNITAGTITTVTNLTNAPTSGDLTATMKASINTEVDTALSDYDAPTKAEMDAAFTEIKGATWATTDTLEAIRDRGDAAWITATGFATHSAADVWAVATRVLTAATNISGPIADQVWEEAIADHSGTAGSTAAALNAAGSAGDPWTTALPGAYGAGSAGFIIGTNLDAILSARTLASASYATASALATVDTVVDGIQTDLSNATDGLGALKTLIDALPSQADITGGAYALNTSATGSIRVVDGTGTDEISLTSGLIAGIAGTITTLDALDTAQDSQHATSQASLSTLLSRLVGTIATGTHQPQSGDAYSYLGTNLGANGVNSTEAGGTGDHLSAIPNMATATALATVDTVADTILSKLVVASGTIDNSLGDATSTVFKTSLTNIDATWNDQLIRITSGALNGQVKPVLSFDQTNGVFTLEEGFTGAPSNGVTFDILPSHVHPVSQIQSGLSTISASDVWASATRTLTAIDEDSTTIDLDAAIRAAVGMSSANLDTQLAGLPTQAEITGGSYSLATDANGRIRIVDGIGTGELDTLSGTVLLRSATQASIDAIQTSTGTKMVRYFSAIARGDGAAFVDLATEVGEINQNYGSGAGSYSTLFDSQEAARDQLVAVGNDVDSVLEDTDELQSDWENGGRLDLLVDAIKAKTDQMTYTVANKLDSNPTPTAAICNKISDHVRRRTQANVEASSDGDTLSLSSLYGFIQQAQESSISGTTLTVNRTDGTTALGTKTLTSNASAEPVTGIA